MKFIAGFSLFAFAAANPFVPSKKNTKQQEYVRSLVSKAVPTANSQIRKLDQDGEYQVDISGYSVKFEQCQFVKAFDDELAEDQDSETVLATKRFVIFRLCPDNACSSCNYNYGEYLVDLDSYLQSTVEYFQNVQENMCQACDECANGDDAAVEGDDAAAAEEEAEGDDAAADGGRKLYTVDCSSCYDECQKIANMENNGYIDATNFLECQMIYDPEDDSKSALYAGPICASSGSKIKIGVFSDENCLYLDSDKEVDDYLMNNDGAQMKLSHALLKQTYSDTCISCKEPADENDNNNGNDADDADAVIEMCENLYGDAAKCEKTHGFESGYGDYYGYENQLAQEEVVCDFMQSLKSGTYDEEGEIIVSGASSNNGGVASTTTGQKFALSFFVIGTVGLAVYAAMLHSKLVKGGANLSSTGGAMA